MSEKINLSLAEMQQRESSHNSQHNKYDLINDSMNKINIELERASRRVEELCILLQNEYSLIERQRLLSELHTVSNEILKVIKRDIQDIPVSNKIISIDKPLIKIERVESVVKFSFPENLPHAIRYDKTARKLNYDYDMQEYFSWCYQSVEQYFKENGSIEFNEKCMVLFLSYYDEQTNPVDHDNIDVKYFIDGAIRRFTGGDGPFNLSHCFIGLKGEKSCTEVYLGREEDILRLMHRLI